MLVEAKSFGWLVAVGLAVVLVFQQLAYDRLHKHSKEIVDKWSTQVEWRGNFRDVTLKHVNHRNLSFYVGDVHWEYVHDVESHVIEWLFDSITSLPGFVMPTNNKKNDSSLNRFPDSHQHHCLMVDVGMNDGFYTQMAAALGCRVESFELQENCIQISSAAASLNGFSPRQITFHHNPVSDTNDKELSLPYSPDLPCSGSFGFTRENCGSFCPESKLTTKKTFKAVSLDALLPRKGDVPKTIHFLKVDVEGHDPLVMRGALNLFSEKRIRRASVEAIPNYWSPGKIDEFIAIYVKILSFGYTIQCAASERYKKKRMTFRKGNETEFAVFMKSDFSYDLFMSI
jgi:FkbM family methyltransferase